MNDTGRIRAPLGFAAARALHHHESPPDRTMQLAAMTEIDRAHLAMLVYVGSIDRKTTAQLLHLIDELCATDFAALQHGRASRGLYLQYEAYLVDRLGEKVGGALHLARSRNDLNATVLLMQLRRPVTALIDEAIRLTALLLARARRHADIVMPLHTHGQPALPGSYGHYLAGIAQPMLRSIDTMLHLVARDLDRCPLGAGAIGGTSIPIRCDMTARLLGFADSTVHSIDAVASRDVVQRLLSEACVLGTLLGRAATDLQTWLGAEHDSLTLPDTLVGSSSMMPQKRNPYLLEHVVGRAARPLGAFVSATAAMQGTRFSNHIAVGTEATAMVWTALGDTTSAVMLMRAMIAGAVPRREAMAHAEHGFLEATEISNRLVAAGMSFRAAHHLVGREITTLLARDPDSCSGALIAAIGAQVPDADLSGLDPRSVMAAARHGGGPGTLLQPAVLDAERNQLAKHGLRLRLFRKRWRDAATALDAKVGALASG